MATQFILATFLLLAMGSPQLPQPVGTWVWHGEWQRAPHGLAVTANADGVVLSFCGDGRLHIASGVLYRDKNTAGLGSSDGLAIYAGNWTEESGQIRTSYALVDAELQTSNSGKLMGIERKVIARFVREELQFTVYRWYDGQPLDLKFSRAATSKPIVGDRFVECHGK
jgi:hypothetical protein